MANHCVHALTLSAVRTDGSEGSVQTYGCKFVSEDPRLIGAEPASTQAKIVSDVPKKL